FNRKPCPFVMLIGGCDPRQDLWGTRSSDRWRVSTTERQCELEPYGAVRRAEVQSLFFCVQVVWACCIETTQTVFNDARMGAQQHLLQLRDREGLMSRQCPCRHDLRMWVFCFLEQLRQRLDHRLVLSLQQQSLGRRPPPRL